MKMEDIITLIEKNRPCIEAAMKEANYNAYMNTSCKYEVRLLPDGSTETRERLASDDWWRVEESSVCKIACYCYQYYNPLDADMDLHQLVNELGEYMDDAEIAAYGSGWISTQTSTRSTPTVMSVSQGSSTTPEPTSAHTGSTSLSLWPRRTTESSLTV